MRQTKKPNISIHPRVSRGGEKLNTAHPRSMRRQQRALRAIEEHLERHPRDSMSQQRVVTLKQELGA